MERARTKGRVALMTELRRAAEWVERELRAGRSIQPGSNAGNHMLLILRSLRWNELQSKGG